MAKVHPGFNLNAKHRDGKNFAVVQYYPCFHIKDKWEFMGICDSYEDASAVWGDYYLTINKIKPLNGGKYAAAAAHAKAKAEEASSL